MNKVWTEEEIQVAASMKLQDYTYNYIATKLTEQFNKTFTSESVRKKLQREGVATTYEPRVSQDVMDEMETPEDYMPPYRETTEIKQDGSQRSDKLIKMNEEEKKDPEFLLKSHGYDPKVFELISSKASIWNQHNKKDGTLTLYSSNISIKPRKDNLSLEAVKEFFEEFAEKYQSPVHEPTNYKVNGKLLEVGLYDLHLAKLGTVLDNNDEYNHEIAEERFFFLINDIIQKVQHEDIEKVLFVPFHDFFNYDADGLTKATTNGTPQEGTLQMQKMFETGVSLLVRGIDLLSQLAPVDVKYIGANHDRVISFFAAQHLKAWYRSNPHISVDADYQIRKYVGFGNNMILLTHGHAENKKIKLGQVMAIEQPEMWAQMPFREAHAGHFHKLSEIEEENGVTTRHLSSLSGGDVWHFEKAYIGSLRRSQTFLYDKFNGLESIIYTNIPVEPATVKEAS